MHCGHILEMVFILSGPSCGLSNSFGLEQDNGDDGLLAPAMHDTIRRYELDGR